MGSCLFNWHCYLNPQYAQGGRKSKVSSNDNNDSQALRSLKRFFFPIMKSYIYRTYISSSICGNVDFVLEETSEEVTMM